MKMTFEQFKAWAATARFNANQEINGETDSETVTGITDDGDEIIKNTAFGTASKTLTAFLPNGSDMELIFQEGVQWEGTTRARYNEHETYILSEPPRWILTGITLVEDDGEVIERRDLLDSIISDVFGLAAPNDATDIDYAQLLPAIKTQDIDITEDSDVEAIEIQIDNAPNIRFTGEQVATASSSANNANSNYSRDNGRWTVLKLFKTQAGKFVCQSIGRTQWQGEQDRYSGAVAEGEAGVIAFFGHGWLAKELYDEAGIADVQDVE